MRSLGVFTVLVALAATPAWAQVRNNRGYGSAQAVPPGQMPPPGMCRVWYDGVPPGRQPRATNCNDAERIASRDRNARVIYGDDYRYRDRDRSNTYPYGNDRYGNDRYGNDRYGTDRYGYPNGSNRGYGYNSVPYDNGYRDGLEKGREDARDRDSFDPVRHSWYRSGNRGYNSRYGTKDQYKLVYRDGFEAGYAQGYRNNGGYSTPSRGARFPWPF